MMLKETEFAVVGTGFLGLALAIDLLQQGHSVSLIGKKSPTLPHPGNRVVAINLASKSYLEYLQVWDKLPAPEPTPYYDMKVWERDTDNHLEFSNQDVNISELGYIVVNSDLEQALWHRLEELTATLDPQKFTTYHEFVTQYQTLQQRHFLTTEAGEQILATFMVVADGGRSFMRQALGIGVDRSEYSQAAITCVVELPQSHQHTAYQSFHQNGILAYLPLANEHQVSVVWSVDNDILKHVLAYDPETFCQEMYACFGNTSLGVPKLISKPTHFPLAKQYAQQIHGNNFVLVGDAAHTIHPLAGQGVNLGFADAWQFSDLVKDYYRPGQGIEQSKFDAYARKRKAQARVVSETMAVIKNTFGSDDKLLKLGRTLAMKLANNVNLVKEQLIYNALGYGETPHSQATFDSKSDLASNAAKAPTVLTAVESVLSQLDKDQVANGVTSFFSKFAPKEKQ